MCGVGKTSVVLKTRCLTYNPPPIAANISAAARYPNFLIIKKQLQTSLTEVFRACGWLAASAGGAGFHLTDSRATADG
jgi:hypothetical protein